MEYFNTQNTSLANLDRQFHDIESPAHLADAIAEGNDYKELSFYFEGAMAAIAVTDAIVELINDNEAFEAFCDHDEDLDEEFFQIGGQICIYSVNTGGLLAGTAQQHAERKVKEFRAYQAELEAEGQEG